MYERTLGRFSHLGKSLWHARHNSYGTGMEKELVVGRSALGFVGAQVGVRGEFGSFVLLFART